MVALVVSMLASVAMTIGITWYATRRPVGALLTWGEATVGSVYVFLLMFLVYGVVPHQWLTLAENEWSWRADRILFGPGDIVRPISQGGWFPFDITFRTLSDSVAVVFYIVYLAAQVWIWVKWQKRDTSRFAGLAAIMLGLTVVAWGSFTLLSIVAVQPIVNDTETLVLGSVLIVGGLGLTGFGFKQKHDDAVSSSPQLPKSSYGRPLVRQG